MRALLIGPMVVPIAYWIAVTAHAGVRGVHVNALQALRELLTITAFGLPIAYAATVLWGAPILYALHRIGWLRAAPVVIVGALGGTIVATVLALGQQGSLFRVQMPLAGGAILGAIAGAACWWAGQGTSSNSRR